MKKIVWLFVVSVSLSVAVFGAENQNRAGKKGSRRLPSSLNLTTQQEQKIHSVDSTYNAKFAEVRTNASLTKQQRQEQMKTLRKARQTEVNQILTPAQQEQLKASANNKKGNRNVKSAKKPMDSLNLTDEQKEKMKVLNEDFRTKSQELRKQHREAINQILTPQQQAQLKEMNGRFEKRGMKHPPHGRQMKGMRGQLDSLSIAKLDSLRQDFDTKKKAIQMSRVAPEEQTRQLGELRKQFRTDRRAVIDQARPQVCPSLDE